MVGRLGFGGLRVFGVCAELQKRGFSNPGSPISLN